MKFDELVNRMNTEGFNPDLFFRGGVVVEASNAEYYPHATGKILRPSKYKKLVMNPNVELNAWEIARNSFKFDLMLREEEKKQGKDRNEFDVMTRERLRKELESML